MSANSFDELREAVVLARDTFDTLLKCDGDADFVRAWATLGIDAMNAALSVPRRNCDIGSAQDMSIRFTQFCAEQHNGENTCGDCPILKNMTLCELEWAQTPYEAKEARSER